MSFFRILALVLGLTFSLITNAQINKRVFYTSATSSGQINTSNILDVCAGQTITFADSSIATPNVIAWHWRIKNVALPDTFNTRSATVTYNNVGLDTVFLRVNNVNSSDSLYFLVRVNAVPVAPTITAAGNTTICNGSSVSLTTTAIGVSYQWRFNGNPIAGATSQSYSANAAGNYTLVVNNNGCNSAPSNGIGVITTAAPDATIDDPLTLFKNCGATSNAPNFLFAIQNISTTTSTNTSYTINWGDGTTESVMLNSTPQAFTHAYETINRFLIELSGPGTVTSADVVGTPSSRLEEIRSFGSLGLQSFKHDIKGVNSEWSTNTSFLKEIPEYIPPSLKELPRLLAHINQPPVSRLGAWDFSNLEDLSGFFNNAQNFDFVLQNQTLPNLLTLEEFALDAKNATFYFDNVHLTNDSVSLLNSFSGITDSEVNWHRVSVNTQRLNRVFQSVRSSEINWTDVSFPKALDFEYITSSCNGLKLKINGLNFPLATSANYAFAIGGSIHGASNAPDNPGEFILSRLSCPNIRTVANMFSGWTNSKMSLALPDFSAVTNMEGLLSFNVGSTVTINGFKTAGISGMLELVTHSYNSTFQFNGFEFGPGTSVNNCFWLNTNCTFEINGLKISPNTRVNNLFLGGKTNTIIVPEAIVGNNANLLGFFSNLKASSKIVANSWLFQGSVNLTNVFSALSESTTVLANDWVFQGTAEIPRLFALNQPVIHTYLGKQAGGTTVTARNWIFNGPTKADDRDANDTDSGLLAATHNAAVDLRGWEFNNSVSMQLGDKLRSSTITLTNWKFNQDADLRKFATDVGFGNQSDFSIDVTGWDFAAPATVLGDGFFENFAKRETTLFGEKPNHPTTVIGMSSWQSGMFDSAIAPTAGIGTDVVGIDLSKFS